MEFQNDNIGKTIVAFHIGRGGRFYNAGHLSFIGCKPIGDFINDLFPVYENASDIFEMIKGRENLEELYRKATEDWDNAAIARLSSLGLDLGEIEYCDGGGSQVGLSQKDAESGIGTINIDHDYDTTYTRYLDDCNRDEINAIIRSDGWRILTDEQQEYVNFLDSVTY